MSHSHSDSDGGFDAGVLVGLHGLALLVVFPLGPQQARLWHPGVPGVAAMAAVYPLAAVLSGLIARRLMRGAVSLRVIAWLGLVAALPAVFSRDYASLLAGRFIAGLAAGPALVALHRPGVFPLSPGAAQLASRLVAFSMPACMVLAAFFDWRWAFGFIATGFAVIAWRTAAGVRGLAHDATAVREPVPAALVATSALAFVTGAFLTVLSGYLVFNAGHTEFHIPIVLTGVALGGLLLSPRFHRLGGALSSRGLYAVTMGAATATLFPLLALQRRLPAILAISAVVAFLVVGAFRHLALGRMVAPALVAPHVSRAHLLHAQLAQHLGFGLGAVVAGFLVAVSPSGSLAGMPGLLVAGLAATVLALTAGLVADRSVVAPSHKS